MKNPSGYRVPKRGLTAETPRRGGNQENYTGITGHTGYSTEISGYLSFSSCHPCKSSLRLRASAVKNFASFEKIEKNLYILAKG
jgi:hypothetical protein